MILIELNGDRQLVDSLDGYDGWSVVADGIDPPPSDHCHFEGGQWVEDETAKAAADREAEFNAMSKSDLVAMIEKMIADAQVAAASPGTVS
jgi:hypothetical protein